ncbi:MAG: acyl carrier protein [Myxococcota bacterium]
MTRTEISERLQRYIVEELLDGDGRDLTPTTPLLQWGLLDSIGIVSLLSFIDDNLGVEVPDDAVRPENFETLEKLSLMLDDIVRKAA